MNKNHMFFRKGVVAMIRLLAGLLAGTVKATRHVMEEEKGRNRHAEGQEGRFGSKYRTRSEDGGKGKPWTPQEEH